MANNQNKIISDISSDNPSLFNQLRQVVLAGSERESAYCQDTAA